MSDSGGDLSALKGLVADYQNKLVMKNPGDPLVEFLFIREFELRDDAWKELIARYNKADTTRPPRGAVECAEALCGYLADLEKATDVYVWKPENKSPENFGPSIDGGDTNLPS